MNRLIISIIIHLFILKCCFSYLYCYCHYNCNGCEYCTAITVCVWICVHGWVCVYTKYILNDNENRQWRTSASRPTVVVRRWRVLSHIVLSDSLVTSSGSVDLWSRWTHTQNHIVYVSLGYKWWHTWMLGHLLVKNFGTAVLQIIFPIIYWPTRTLITMGVVPDRCQVRRSAERWTGPATLLPPTPGSRGEPWHWSPGSHASWPEAQQRPDLLGTLICNQFILNFKWKLHVQVIQKT